MTGTKLSDFSYTWWAWIHLETETRIYGSDPTHPSLPPSPIPPHTTTTQIARKLGLSARLWLSISSCFCWKLLIKWLHPRTPLHHASCDTLGIFPQKNGLSCLEYNSEVQWFKSFVWSQSINSRKASFSRNAPLKTHSKRFIITITGGGYPFKNFQTMVEAEFTWDKSCNRDECGVWVGVCVGVLWKQKRLSNSRQDKLF